MNFTETNFSGLFLVDYFEALDTRGAFIKPWVTEEFLGVFGSVAEVYSTYTEKNVLRGLHYQVGDYAQKKYIVCLSGVIEDIALDLRKGSLTYGEIFRITLKGMDGRSVIVPEGFAHAIFAYEDAVTLTFCDKKYSPDDERGVNWKSLDGLNDLSVNKLSEKDLALPNYDEQKRNV